MASPPQNDKFYEPDEIRKLMLSHLKAFLLFYLDPDIKSYKRFQEVHQDVDDVAYTIWDMEYQAEQDADDDDQSQLIVFDDPEAVEKAMNS